MKVLIVGILSFIAWSFFSSWFYTCKIRHMCGEETRTGIELVQENIVVTEVPEDTLVTEPLLSPENMKIHFDYNSADFTPGIDIVAYLQKGKQYLEANRQSVLELVGHADATGQAAYNLKLGLRRANSVREYFLQNGILPENIKVSSKGEMEPIADNNTEEGRTENRRVELTIKTK